MRSTSLGPSSLRAPIIFATLLVVAGVGYAAYSSSANTNVSLNTASFQIVFTALTDPGAPPNINEFQYSSLPSSLVTLQIGNITGGQTMLVDYTVEDIGTLPAHNVIEKVVETFTDCDGVLALAQVGLGPVVLNPGVPVTAVISITDNAAPGPVPVGCSDPFQAAWTLSVTGTAVL